MLALPLICDLPPPQSGHSALQVLEGVGPRRPAALTRGPFYPATRSLPPGLPCGPRPLHGDPCRCDPSGSAAPLRATRPTPGSQLGACSQVSGCCRIQMCTNPATYRPSIFRKLLQRQKYLLYAQTSTVLGFCRHRRRDQPGEGAWVPRPWGAGGTPPLGCPDQEAKSTSSLLVTQSEGGPWLGRKTTLPTPSPRQGFAEWGEGHTSPCNHTGGKRQRRKTPRRSLCFSRRS